MSFSCLVFPFLTVQTEKVVTFEGMFLMLQFLDGGCASFTNIVFIICFLNIDLVYVSSGLSSSFTSYRVIFLSSVE